MIATGLLRHSSKQRQHYIELVQSHSKVEKSIGLLESSKQFALYQRKAVKHESDKNHDQGQELFMETFRDVRRALLFDDPQPTPQINTDSEPSSNIIESLTKLMDKISKNNSGSGGTQG